jgi:DNA-binding transcriptional regulator YiaG
VRFLWQSRRVCDQASSYGKLAATPSRLRAGAIHGRALREREDVSQSVFASYLNVTKDSVSKWERGEKKPAGPSLKLLSLVERKGQDGIAENTLLVAGGSGPGRSATASRRRRRGQPALPATASAIPIQAKDAM